MIRFYNNFRVIKLTVNQLASSIFGGGGGCLFDLFWELLCYMHVLLSLVFGRNLSFFSFTGLRLI